MDGRPGGRIMKRDTVTGCGLIIFAGIAILLCGCGRGSGKVPITTASDEARQLYIKGRDLYERLRFQEALKYYYEAIALDSDFALAYYNLGLNSRLSENRRYEMLKKAVSLIDGVSEGERLMILALQARMNSELSKAKEYDERLVALYPDDERAHCLLGDYYYFFPHDYEKAIQEYNKAIEINRDFSPPYNMLGYSYRSLGDFPEAEKAFKRYIELIPNDPNPYDSYAELLMKMGKYGESIESYYEALSINPDFYDSHIGIATNLNYLGKYKDARDQLKEFYDLASNDNQRRQALFAMVVSYVDEGNMDKALETEEESFRLAEKMREPLEMAGDWSMMGYILLELGRPKEAEEKFTDALGLIEKSDRSEEYKENARRTFVYQSSIIALKEGKMDQAQAKWEEFDSLARSKNDPGTLEDSHGLAGLIALERKQYDKAIAELNQADLWDPRVLFRIATAYQKQGNLEEAKKWLVKVVDFNSLNDLGYAFIRNKAKETLSEINNQISQQAKK
jgi:tetratricopeptide (TPR) repeat protein